MGRHFGYITPRLLPRKHPTMLDIAWAAGIYEGEGTTCFNNKTEQVVVSQKDPWILKKLREFFGGSVNPKTGGGFNWLISGSLARGFLMTIFTFQSPWRKEQIKKCLWHLSYREKGD